MHQITVTPSNNLVDITLSGLMSPDDVRTYIADLTHQMVKGRLSAGYRMIIDVSDCPIQTQDMINTMASHMSGMLKAGAIAIVTGSSLARMQVRRLFHQPYARVVGTPAEARAWVLSGMEPGA